MQPRFKGPTVTPRFLSLPYNNDTPSGGASPLQQKKNCEPRFKSLTATSRFSTSETRAFGRCVQTSTKNLGEYTSSTTMQKSHRNTSLSQPSLQQRHTPSSGASALLQKNCESFPPLQPRCKSPTVTRLFLSLPCNRDTRALGGASPLQQKMCESFHLSTHDAKVPPLHVASSAFPTVETHAFRAVRPHFTEKVCESCNLSTHGAKVPP